MSYSKFDHTLLCLLKIFHFEIIQFFSLRIFSNSGSMAMLSSFSCWVFTWTLFFHTNKLILNQVSVFFYSQIFRFLITFIRLIRVILHYLHLCARANRISYFPFGFTLPLFVRLCLRHPNGQNSILFLYICSQIMIWYLCQKWKSN